VSEVSDRYALVASAFTDRLEGVGPDAWATTTPCTEWTVRDIVVHVIDTHRRVVATLEGAAPVPVDPDAPLPAQWAPATAAVADALADDSRASTTVSAMFGEQTFESLVGRLLCTDTLVHTWDLARATGQDERLDPRAVERSFAFLAPLDDAIRRPGGFGPKISSPPEADAQTRFLSFCGRDPSGPAPRSTPSGPAR